MYNYKSSGVDLIKADLLTETIKKNLNSENIGNFAGVFEHPCFPDYYLVSCIDGVGTKVIPLIERGLISAIAKDLIAMNLNDLVCLGAKPLFFLDYFSTNKLNLYITSNFIEELHNELANYNCILLGGETAELPDLIKDGHFDVAGFAIGAVKKDNILKKENVKEGDIIIALSSSGPHSNGFTLIRKLHDEKQITDDEFEKMLEPSYIYVNEIIDLTDKNLLKACANITGGGIKGNLTRVIPKDLCAKVNISAIPKNPVFEKLEEILGEEEAYNVFNMGVGMCIITAPENKDKVLDLLGKYNPFEFGEITKSENSINICFW